jgi:hypothetical protein
MTGKNMTVKCKECEYKMLKGIMEATGPILNRNTLKNISDLC